MLTIYTIHEGDRSFYSKSHNDKTLKVRDGGQEMKEPWLYPEIGGISNARFQISRSRRGLQAVVDDELIAHLTKKQADLWVPRTCVIRDDGIAPLGFRMYLNGGFHHWRLISFRHEGDGGDGFDADSAALFAIGLLYKKVKDNQVFEDIELQERGEDFKVDAGAVEKDEVRINPLVLKFSIQRGNANSGGSARIDPQTVETWLTHRPMLDLHFVPDEADLPRLKLQELVWGRWKDEPQRPVLPSLLLGIGEPLHLQGSPPLPACFPLLDLMGGTFFIDNFAGPEATRWRWLPGVGFDNRPDLRWLAGNCAKRLGLDVIDSAEAPKVSAIERKREDYERQARQGTFVEEFSESNGASMRQLLPTFLLDVTASKMGRVIRKPAESHDSPSQFQRFRFIEEAGRWHLLPLSTILVQLPAAPSLLAESDRLKWEHIRATVRFDPRISPIAATAWWLQFLEKWPACMPRESETWSLWANSGLPFWSWWWSWYAAIFQQSPDWQPIWEPPSAVGRLAKTKLGTLRLGARGTLECQLDVERCLAVEIAMEGAMNERT